MDNLRHHRQHEHLASPFGGDRFGQAAEKLARMFGTPRYIVVQTGIVLLWIAVNAVAISLQWDPYPFILLNLAFSTQAAYAAPLILLAQTRQADRDKANAEADANHREEIARWSAAELEANTTLTREVRDLSGEVKQLAEEIRQHVAAGSAT